jgi:hypothetical protein
MKATKQAMALVMALVVGCGLMLVSVVGFSGSAETVGAAISDADLYAVRGAQVLGTCITTTTACTGGIACTYDAQSGVCVNTSEACGSCTGPFNQSCAASNTTWCFRTPVPCCSTGFTCTLTSNINNPCQCTMPNMTAKSGTRIAC